MLHGVEQLERHGSQRIVSEEQDGQDAQAGPGRRNRRRRMNSRINRTVNRNSEVMALSPGGFFSDLSHRSGRFLCPFETRSEERRAACVHRTRDANPMGPAGRSNVICAAHLDDVLLAGRKSRDTDCRHAGFGSRPEHTEHFDAGHQIRDLFGDLIFIFMKPRRRSACIEQIFHVSANGFGIAAEYGRPARLEEIGQRFPSISWE